MASPDQQEPAHHSSETECPICLQLVRTRDLQCVNKNKQACPECYREIMRDFRACDE